MAETNTSIHHLRVRNTLYEIEDQEARQSTGTVTSVNGKTGDVSLDADDVGALPSDTPVPTKTSQLTNDSGFITSAPVQSVNGKTGAVTLNASDINAIEQDAPNTENAVISNSITLADGIVKKMTVNHSIIAGHTESSGVSKSYSAIEDSILVGAANNVVDGGISASGLFGNQNIIRFYNNNGDYGAHSWFLIGQNNDARSDETTAGDGPVILIGMGNDNYDYGDEPIKPCTAIGYRLTCYNQNSLVIGQGNRRGTVGSNTGWFSGTATGDAFIIGNGSSSSRSNSFRVTFEGATYGLSAFNSSGADYAEYFEWVDGNPNDEDRVGYFVTMNGNKILKANHGDYILGIVSGFPAIIGNADEDWLGRWQRDEFNRLKYGTYMAEVTEDMDPETGEIIHYDPPIEKEVYGILPNTDYLPSTKYVERKDRKEWDAVGMMGVLSVRDDGTCLVNGFCDVANGGIATAGSTYRVIERVKDNVVKIIFR